MPSTAKPADSLRVNLHVLIDLDPAKWTPPASSDGDGQPADVEQVAAALEAGGFTAEQAEAMAHAAVTTGTASGVSAVRDQIRAYVLAELRKLSRLAEIGATVSYYERPVKK